MVPDTIKSENELCKKYESPDYGIDVLYPYGWDEQGQSENGTIVKLLSRQGGTIDVYLIDDLKLENNLSEILQSAIDWRAKNLAGFDLVSGRTDYNTGKYPAVALQYSYYENGTMKRAFDVATTVLKN
jgi:hypothetical protein